MSEAGPVRGIIIAHGALAAGLADAARAITGVDEHALRHLSNRGLSPAALAERLAEAAGAGPLIVFTDLPSGSCGVTARLLARDRVDTAVVCGVNLPMLLDFLTHRDLPVTVLVPRLLERARASIQCSPASYQSHADSTDPRG
ncbi:MAG: hypothetical protein L0271_07590 [Gemmatimonadetes bacterium]|nr:hypothetical protein [Gemmatimonadota bacterium]